MKRPLFILFSAFLITGFGKIDDAGNGNIQDPVWLQKLPVIRELPDPFLMDNGKRVASFDDWNTRRKELKELIQKYEYGHLDSPVPVRVSGSSPDSVISGGQSKVVRKTYNLVTGNKGEIAFTVNLFIPGSGEGPFPVVLTGDRTGCSP